MVALMAGSAFGGSLESGGRFCVGAFGRNLASVALKMFSHEIYIFKEFYKFCTFNAICKDNSARNRITVQHKTGSFPSTLTGNTTLVHSYLSFGKLGYLDVWPVWNNTTGPYLMFEDSDILIKCLPIKRILKLRFSRR
jgi:hypothetical protein